MTTLTFTRLVLDPVSGVPSLFSALPCLTAAASSRIGRRWFRSAYLRHEIPHASHSTGVGRPFGAFHHNLVSRVRHAPHDACALLGVRTIEPSESESSAEGTARADEEGVLELLRRDRLRFSSPSFMLCLVRQMGRKNKTDVDILFPMPVIAHDFIDRACANFVTDGA